MITKPPGVEDIFPDRSDRWNFVKDTAISVFRRFNYRELIVPVMEFTEVFSRGIGADTDIVSKEMFTFEDRGGRSLTLRPEGTAGVVRAYVENGEYNRLSLCKFFYYGPMFRAEKPQKGRLRQFNQFGAEIFGSSDPYYDSEIISVVNRIATEAGVGLFSIHLNSIGCKDCRREYIIKLKEYYKNNFQQLCPDCKRRFETNPLRLLDCKNQSCAALKDNAPVIRDYLCGECSTHYAKVKEYLDLEGIKYEEDPHMVRGLDYYTKTTFEFVSDRLGSQSAFAGGGRYDYLVEQFEGKPTPGVGFAAGMERINLLIEGTQVPQSGPECFIMHSGGASLVKGVELVYILRSKGISADIDPEVKGFKSQMKRADREHAVYALIIGDNELASGKASVKNLSSGLQEEVEFTRIDDYIISRR
ncbi:MAG TPA: histidine--tRNA ligase [Spirochaetota bacterium]|nr:histidine--tRNA ligase [Spirochaetota bacterium]